MILEYFMTLVPTKPNEDHLVLPNGCTVDYDTTEFFKILLGGDQLTVARVRGTQALRQTEDTAENRLQGLIPVIEDWHARMALVKVICKQNIVFSLWIAQNPYYGLSVKLCEVITRYIT